MRYLMGSLIFKSEFEHNNNNYHELKVEQEDVNNRENVNAKRRVVTENLYHWTYVELYRLSFRLS